MSIPLHGGACGSEVVEIQLGKLVEIHNESGEDLCPATASHTDAFLEDIFFTLGEEPPTRRFVEYRWGGPSYSGLAWKAGSTVTIEAGIPLHEHELVHAVHLEAWPRGPAFLHEGLAELLGNSFLHQDAGPSRPTGADLDEVLEGRAESLNYGTAWLVVSQIVLEHGLPGLREFWFSLQDSSSMSDVRAAYEESFGGSLDDLTQPFEMVIDGRPSEFIRGVCWVVPCTGEPLPWEDGRVVAHSVTGCDEEAAVSAAPAVGRLFPWRDYLVRGDAPTVGPATVPGVYVEIKQCGVLTCDHFTVRDAGLANPPREAWERDDTYRVRVQADPAMLDPGVDPTFELLAE